MRVFASRAVVRGAYKQLLMPMNVGVYRAAEYLIEKDEVEGGIFVEHFPRVSFCLEGKLA